MESLESLSKTLFIPLAVRATESKKANSVIHDEKAFEILTQIETNGLIIDGGRISSHGILARTKVIDDEIIKIISV